MIVAARHGGQHHVSIVATVKMIRCKCESAEDVFDLTHIEHCSKRTLDRRQLFKKGQSGLVSTQWSSQEREPLQLNQQVATEQCCIGCMQLPDQVQLLILLPVRHCLDTKRACNSRVRIMLVHMSVTSKARTRIIIARFPAMMQHLSQMLWEQVNASGDCRHMSKASALLC